MAKKLNSQQLRREIIEAIVILSSRTPLYSIRLEDISNFINTKYQFDEKSSYRTGSILAALNNAMSSFLTELEDSGQNSNILFAKQFKYLEDFLWRTRSSDLDSKRVGRWRRTTLLIKFLTYEYIWEKLSPLRDTFKLNIHPALKLKLIADYFLSFALTEKSFSGELGEGMREIFIMECTLPSGTRMGLEETGTRWLEPISPSLVNFFASLDRLVLELQYENIFEKRLNPKAIRLAFFGSLMGLAQGDILRQRIGVAPKDLIQTEYSPEQALESVLPILLGFCKNKEAQEKFKSEWSH